MKKILSSISGEFASPIGALAQNAVGGKSVDEKTEDTLKDIEKKQDN